MGSPNASLAQRGQAVVPGSSPYMVPESGFRPAQFPHARNPYLVQTFAMKLGIDIYFRYIHHIVSLSLMEKGKKFSCNRCNRWFGQKLNLEGIYNNNY